MRDSSEDVGTWALIVIGNAVAAAASITQAARRTSFEGVTGWGSPWDGRSRRKVRPLSGRRMDVLCAARKDRLGTAASQAFRVRARQNCGAPSHVGINGAVCGFPRG